MLRIGSIQGRSRPIILEHIILLPIAKEEIVEVFVLTSSKVTGCKEKGPRSARGYICPSEIFQCISTAKVFFLRLC